VTFWRVNFPKIEKFDAYINRSYDLSKVNAYDSKSPRTGEFDRLHNEFLESDFSQKGNF